jgi:hypothetical protein
LIRDGGKPSRGFRFSPDQIDRILTPLAPKQAAGNGGPSGAGRSAGDWTAQGGVNYNAWSNLNSVNTNLDATTIFASQQSVAALLSSQNQESTWADILAIPSGIAGYQGSGTLTCSGSACLSAFNGGTTFTYGINVNFGTQQIGGDSNSQITLPGYVGSANLGPVNYSAFSGKAICDISSVLGSSDFGIFSSGTTAQFIKTSAGAAGALRLNIVYTLSGGGTATGTSQAAAGPPNVIIR